MRSTTLWLILKEAGDEWVVDKAHRLAAAIAFYAIFSLAPFLVITVSAASVIFGEQAAQGQVRTQIEHLLGSQGGEAVQAIIESATQSGNGTFATLLGIAMLIVGAAGMFAQLQDALNTVWEVQPKPGRGFGGFLRDRVLSLSMVLGVAFLLLISLIVSTSLAATGTQFGDWQGEVWGHTVTGLLDCAVITILFAAIYKFLPDAEIGWRDVWLGAALTAFLFTMGKFLIGLYLGRAGVASPYGAAGSLAVLLIWLYFASLIFLFGAEVTKAFANKLGSHIRPKPHAESVTPQTRAQEGLSRKH